MMPVDISVTDFKRRCLEIVRRVERTGQPISITRRGKVVARLAPSHAQPAPRRPLEALRELGGELLAEPSELALRNEDFEALR
jgi:prevent-host-death family protein